MKKSVLLLAAVIAVSLGALSANATGVTGTANYTNTTLDCEKTPDAEGCKR